MGDHFSVVKWLFSEFVVAKKGTAKLVLFTPVIYWHQKKKERQFVVVW